jgi:iron(II)-dependent oxidoreductase
MQTTSSPANIHADLEEARSRTDELFEVVRPDSLFERPVPERHRLNFYIGHIEAFDWNMICEYELSMPAFNRGFNELYAFGIDPDESGLPTDQPKDWPSLAQTREYCKRVRETIDRVISEVPEDIAQTCLEHRLMHAETLSYLLHNLDSEHKCGPMAEPCTPASSPARQWIEIPAGTATLGRPKGSGFGWDNEFSESSVAVPAFEVSKYKVTNGDYLEYANQGGEVPHYWKRVDGEWWLRTMFGEIPLPLDWPVYATHTQALAFAEQAGSSLPSEAQFDRAGYGSLGGQTRAYPWGNQEPERNRGNFDFHHWDQTPVTAYPNGDSAFGVSQLLGNGWEWTADVFRPLPGFEPYPFYPGYSADFFDDDHYVIKGGSPRTAGKLLRRSFRNWFRRDYKYLFATIRLVRN